MLDKLQELEQVLSQISTQYHVLATELANLKNKPNNDAQHTATINDLMQKLEQATTHNQQLQAELSSSTQKKDEEIAIQSEIIANLTEQNEQLKQLNTSLEQKNRIAAEHVKTIETWLANIDNAQSH